MIADNHLVAADGAFYACSDGASEHERGQPFQPRLGQTAGFILREMARRGREMDARHCFHFRAQPADNSLPSSGWMSLMIVIKMPDLYVGRTRCRALGKMLLLFNPFSNPMWKIRLLFGGATPRQRLKHLLKVTQPMRGRTEMHPAPGQGKDLDCRITGGPFFTALAVCHYVKHN